MSVQGGGVTVQTTDDADEADRMVIIGTDEIQVHPDLSTTQHNGEGNLVQV